MSSPSNGARSMPISAKRVRMRAGSNVPNPRSCVTSPLPLDCRRRPASPRSAGLSRGLRRFGTDLIPVAAKRCCIRLRIDASSGEDISSRVSMSRTADVWLSANGA